MATAVSDGDVSVGTDTPARMLAGVHARARRTACFFCRALVYYAWVVYLAGCVQRRASFIFGLYHLLLYQQPTTHHLGPLPLTQCCATAKMAPVRRAPYKDFLQPALHRRFTSTATILLAIAFVEAVVLASWDSRQLRPAPRTNSFRRQPANIVRALQSSGRSSRSVQLAFEPFLSSFAASQSSSSESHSTMSASVPPTPACRPSSNTP
jgi:hypothetical protein